MKYHSRNIPSTLRENIHKTLDRQQYHKYYNRYVDDIFVIFESTQVTEDIILNYMNSISKHSEFKMTAEVNNSISYLYLTMVRKTDEIELDIYRRPSATSTTIHALSNHPTEHKTASY